VGVKPLLRRIFPKSRAEELVESLLDNLTTRRLEIDMLEFSGIEFRNVDNRVMALKLVQIGPERRSHVRPEPRGAAAVRHVA